MLPLNQQVNRLKYHFAIRSVLRSPPQKLSGGGIAALSMVHHRDVLPYLLAIKSFCRDIAPSRVIVVADPSITDADRRTMRDHVEGIEIVPAEGFREPGMPQGGCWERLTAISEYVQDQYVVQLDADTVTLAKLPEVRAAIDDDRSFVLATEDGDDFVSCAQAAAWAKSRVAAGEHVQIMAEANLDRLPDAPSCRYVRGCAGFSGFAKGSFDRDKLRHFSHTMAAILGDRWTAWGTEQFTSNFMVANSPRALVLPHPKYCHPGRERPGTVFLHFIGYVRFQTDRYARAARETLADLNAGA